jgi:predicted metal-dependent enzyme (double-stranded beta helix superfamily)
MKKIIEKLKSLESNVIEPNILKTTLDAFDFANVDYMQYLNEKDFDKYHRVTILESPLKVFLTVWPPEFLLSTHQHNNFWGYLAVLKGLLTETFFVYDPDDAQLSCHPPKSYRKGEVVFEPLNVIHHIQNPSPSKPLVTAHFYYPTVYDYDGVLIFDIRNKRIAELNDKAPGVSWNHPADYYRRFEENAFSVVNLW